MRLASRSATTLLTLTTTIGLLAAGCGSGSSDGSMSKEEVATQVDAACNKLSGYSIWLPEHLEKTGKSLAEGKAQVDRAAEDFRSTLVSLDPPADLREPIEALAKPEDEPGSRGELKAGLERRRSLYERVGADRCAKGVEASLRIALDGVSVEDAYEQVGLPLPPHPESW